MKLFEHFDLSKDLLSHLSKTHYKTPTPIQEKAIPVALTSRDIIGIAQTGTGKTAAFLLPAITHLLSGARKQLLILAPTRELAIQIQDVFIELTRPFRNMRSVVLIGGASMHKQIHQLAERPSMIVATPGRLNDHIRRRTIHLQGPMILVVDEMDRMMDMGFLPQIESILAVLPRDRQTLMFSATFPVNIKKLAEKHTKSPELISIDSAPKASDNIEQSHIELPGTDKNERVLNQVKAQTGPVLVFTRTKMRADRLARFLKTNAVRAIAIHGNRSQSQRQDAIRGFLDGRYSVLVATDIASRGLDIPSISLVINFDLPETREDYIHRIGRTARGGAKGLALSLVTPDEMQHWRSISKTATSGEPTRSQPRAQRKRPSHGKFRPRFFKGPGAPQKKSRA